MWKRKKKMRKKKQKNRTVEEDDEELDEVGGSYVLEEVLEESFGDDMERVR